MSGKKKKESRKKKWFKLFKIDKKNGNDFLDKVRKNFLFFREQDFNLKLFKIGFSKKRLFTNEIVEIMYGYGDSDKPLKKSVFEIEKLISSYVTRIILKISHISFWKNEKRPWVDDLLFLFRNVPRKMQRITYLLKMKYIIENIMVLNKPVRAFGKKMVEKL